jgi:hypothetical protein
MSTPQKEITIEKASENFQEVFETVQATKKPITVKAPDGTSVRILPVPQPIGMFKGKPIYKAEDIQFVGAPWFFD